MSQSGPERTEKLAFIGFGEAATAFLSGWAENRPMLVSAFDIKTDAANTRAGMLERYGNFRVDGADHIADALAEADVVFSVVTADQARAAAQAASRHIPKGALWLDCNSCAPDTKRQAARLIEAAGGHYVDVAVMAPVHPKRHKVPLLISGPNSERAREVLLGLEMVPAVAGERVGAASAIKMLRSVMVKGLEALTTECLLAARQAGVEEQVLASLEASDPEVQWRKRASYNLERMMMHGARRAAEMREVAATISALGLPNGMSVAAADWQKEIAEVRATPGDDDLTERLDRILASR